MNLRPVNPPEPHFFATCLKCAASVRSDHALADLDGEPFRAYYCARCGFEVLPAGLTLYAKLQALGCELDSHESDLYVRLTPLAALILRASGYKFGTFVSQLDGKAWADIPFMFAPFWEAVQRRSETGA